jgi:hypothetical protein
MALGREEGLAAATASQARERGGEATKAEGGEGRAAIHHTQRRDGGQHHMLEMKEGQQLHVVQGRDGGAATRAGEGGGAGSITTIATCTGGRKTDSTMTQDANKCEGHACKDGKWEALPYHCISVYFCFTLMVVAPDTVHRWVL